jgi:hypothetical protein
MVESATAHHNRSPRYSQQLPAAVDYPPIPSVRFYTYRLSVLLLLHILPSLYSQNFHAVCQFLHVSSALLYASYPDT